jgi:hypothetical protein
MATDEKALDNGELYLRVAMNAIRQIDGLPIALVASTTHGPMVVIAADFPDAALPSREEWIAMYPGDRRGSSLRVAVPASAVRNH